jgi:hypothetical protein
MSLPVATIEPDDLVSNEGVMEDTIDKVHPDLLPPQHDAESSPPTSTMSKILTHLSTSNILLYCVFRDCAICLQMYAFSFSILLVVQPALAAIVSLTTERKQCSRKGQKRVLAKIISTYPDQNTPNQWFFVIQYIVDGITYQKKFLYKTFGVLSTEKFLEVVVNNNDPKDAVLAVEVDHYNTHRVQDWHQLHYAWNVMTLILPLILLTLECSPTLSIHLSSSAMHDQCSMTTWIDALAHYFIVIALFLIQQLLSNYIAKRKPVGIQAVALDTVTKPFVPPPQSYNDVVDQSILLLSPCTHYSSTYNYAACLFFGMWMIYGVSKYSNNVYKTCLFLVMMIFTAILAFCVAIILVDYIYFEPLQSQFREEGLPLKNMTVLESTEVVPSFLTKHIIQYEVDVINITGTSSIVKVYACTSAINPESLCILPLQPTSICTPGPPGLSPGPMYALMASPLGCISFYDWNESDDWHEKCVFALVTATLCMLGSLCIAISTLDMFENITDKSKEFKIVTDGNKLT